MATDGRTQVVIAGGGVAALEAALALRDLAGDLVAITLVAPEERFTYRPLTVGEPFALGEADVVELAEVARDVEAGFVRDALDSVDAGSHEAVLASGERLRYDALLVATGARRVPAFEHAHTFRGQEDSESVRGLIRDLEGGYVQRIVFVVPSGVAWQLPLYELALMTAQRAYDMSLDVDLTLVTPENSPLAAFGPAASADVGRLLDEAGIHVEVSKTAEVPEQGTVLIRPGGRILGCDRIVALPRIEPIEIGGLPQDGAGFVPIDSRGRVSGVADVYAAGDGTSFPVKQGGIACQEADAAASAIARAAGADVHQQIFQPVLRGQLMTGSRPLFMRSDISGTVGDQSISSGHTLWWPPSKVAGEYLAPYLDGRQQRVFAGHGGAHVRHIAPVTDALRQGHDVELLGFDTSGD
jgi:sulfide:quinone oxidoreductase